MKKSVLVFSMTSLLLIGGMNMAIAQEKLDFFFSRKKVVKNQSNKNLA